MQYKQEKQSIAIIKRMYSKMSSESDGLNILEEIFDLSANASPEFKVFLDSIQKLVIHKISQYPGVSYRDALAQYKVDETHTALDFLEHFTEALECASYDELVFGMNTVRYEKDRISAFGIGCFLNIFDSRIEWAGNYIAFTGNHMSEFAEKPVYSKDNACWQGPTIANSFKMYPPNNPEQFIFERKRDRWVWIGNKTHNKI